ncbi:MAG: heme o synthase [candidate division WOR-3 bacterium]
MKFIEITKHGITLWVGITTFGGSIIAHGDVFKSIIISLFVMLSAGGSAVLNNYFDRDIDKIMERTKNRALASNKINPKFALIYGILLCVIGLLGLLKFSFIAFLLDLIAIISYSFVYTFLKRKTAFSLIIGSIPGALPPSIGYTAIKNEFDILAFSLFALMFVWQPAHFIYLSIFIKNDYEKVKIPVISVIYGNKYAKLLSFVYSISLFPITLLLYIIGDLSKMFLLFATSLNLFWLFFNFLYYKQIVRERMMFILSNLYVLFIFLLIAFDKFIL